MTEIRVFDNKKSWDRYTVVINDSYFGMSTNATAPDGFNQYGGETKDLVKNDYGFFNEAVLGKEIKNLEKLPAPVKQAISDRIFKSF